MVYKLDASGNLTVLYVFPGAGSNLEPDGPNPGVILDSDGNLYGATANGGVGGMIYKLKTSGQETMLYSFSGAPGGTNPPSGVTRDTVGNSYGVSSGDGAANAGMVYKVDEAGRETVLYSFTGGPTGHTQGRAWCSTIRATSTGPLSTGAPRTRAWYIGLTRRARRPCSTALAAGPMGASH